MRDIFQELIDLPDYSLWEHDRNRNIGKEGLIRSVGIKTAVDVEKYHVDLMGNLHKVRNEKRKS